MGKKLTFLLLFFCGVLFPQLGPEAQVQESGIEALLSQADVLYIQGNYEKARSLYLEASRMAEKNMHLSRAFFGAALCSFYLGDATAARENLQRVFTVDPKKEISALFYPQDFLRIFGEVKKQVLSGEPQEPFSSRQPVKAEEKEKAPEKGAAIGTIAETGAKKPDSLPPKPVSGKEPSAPMGGPRPAVSSREDRYLLGGHLEMGVHYGGWSLEPALSLFQKTITKRIGSEIRRELTDHLSSLYGPLVQSSYEQELSLKVDGWNEGFVIRYYSQGEKGSMSLGFSLEKTHLRLETAGSIRQVYGNGSIATVDATAFVEANPICGHISFRWDFKPSWRLTPYFIFGLGFGPLNGKMGFVYTGTYKFLGYQEAIKDSQEKSFESWAEQEGSHIRLKTLLLLQMSLGLKMEIYQGFYLQAEAGIWDGFLLRAGLAFRL